MIAHLDKQNGVYEIYGLFDHRGETPVRIGEGLWEDDPDAVERLLRYNGIVIDRDILERMLKDAWRAVMCQ